MPSPPPVPAEPFPYVFGHGERALFLVVAALLILGSHAVDVLLAHGPNWPAFSVRLGWALLLLATAAAVRRGQLGPMRILGALAAFGSAACYLALVQVTGRSRAQILSFAYVLAMAVPLIMPEVLWVSIPAAMLLLVGAWATLVLGGASLPELAGWGHIGLVALGLGWIIAQALRRARLAEQQAAAEREATQARLAGLEQQRAAADRLAALGQLAAEVAHEINNPLAAARSSATFLGDRLAQDDVEGREARRDLVASLDRIAESVRRIKRDTTPAEEPPETEAKVG